MFKHLIVKPVLGRTMAWQEMNKEKYDRDFLLQLYVFYSVYKFK